MGLSFGPEPVARPRCPGAAVDHPRRFIRQGPALPGRLTPGGWRTAQAHRPIAWRRPESGSLRVWKGSDNRWNADGKRDTGGQTVTQREASGAIVDTARLPRSPPEAHAKRRHVRSPLGLTHRDRRYGAMGSASRAWDHGATRGACKPSRVGDGLAVNGSQPFLQHPDRCIPNGGRDRRRAGRMTRKRIEEGGEQGRRNGLVGTTRLRGHGGPRLRKRRRFFADHRLEFPAITRRGIGSGQGHACDPLGDHLRDRQGKLDRLFGDGGGRSRA